MRLWTGEYGFHPLPPRQLEALQRELPPLSYYYSHQNAAQFLLLSKPLAVPDITAAEKD